MQRIPRGFCEKYSLMKLTASAVCKAVVLINSQLLQELQHVVVPQNYK